MESRLPLGICKQAVMKLDSFMTDIREIVEDPEITDEDRAQFEKMAEVSGDMTAIICNMVNREMPEEDFINEHIDMDEIDEYPEKDIMDEEIE